MIDIKVVSTMDYVACVELQKAIAARIAELHTVRAAELREKWRQEAAALGLEPEMLLDGRSGRKRRGRSRRSGNETT